MPPKLSDPQPFGKGQPTPESSPGEGGNGGGLSDAQFARIEELLLPGYELSKLMLADYARHHTLPIDPGQDHSAPVKPDAAQQGSIL